MAFKLKKKIDKIVKMDFESYAKYLKKEIHRAAPLGELDAVICGSHVFPEKGDTDQGKTSSLILFGAFTGDLAAFFKDNKTKPGFARGKCFFESTKNGVILHIAINQGKGKPDKIKKSGKKLWSKLGMDAQLYKDALPILGKELDTVNIGGRKLVKEVDLNNNDQSIELILQQYQQAKKKLQEHIVPLINDKETSADTYTNQHFKTAKTTYRFALSFLDKFEEIESEQQVNYQKYFDSIQKDCPSIKRITAKIKKALMASNSIAISLDKRNNPSSQRESIKNSLTELEKEFKHLAELKPELLEAIEFLNQQSK
jgi:hypothetical protein